MISSGGGKFGHCFIYICICKPKLRTWKVAVLV